MLTVVSPPPQTDFVTLARCKSEFGITDTSKDSLLTEWIKDASDAIVEHCRGYQLARGLFQETVAGFGRPGLVLDRRPIAGVSQVLGPDGEEITDFTIEDAKAGILRRAGGWTAQPILHEGLVDNPLPDSEELNHTVDYGAGFLLPGADLTAQTTISAAASDKSFNDSAGGLPLLQPGEFFVVSGFANAANNGTHKVVSRTASKIVTESTLVTEAAGPTVALACRNLPRTIERAALEIVRALLDQQAAYSAGGSASGGGTVSASGAAVSRVKIGPVEIAYSESSALSIALDSLSEWVDAFA